MSVATCDPLTLSQSVTGAEGWRNAWVYYVKIKRESEGGWRKTDTARDISFCQKTRDKTICDLPTSRTFSAPSLVTVWPDKPGLIEF